MTNPVLCLGRDILQQKQRIFFKACNQERKKKKKHPSLNLVFQILKKAILKNVFATDSLSLY